MRTLHSISHAIRALARDASVRALGGIVLREA